MVLWYIIDNMNLLNYKDIVLNRPSFSTIISRDNLSASVVFLGHMFRTPAVPSNMATSISYNMAENLSDNRYFYILHRFYDYKNILDWVKKRIVPYFSLSVGVKDRDRKFIQDLAKTKIPIDFITIDVAHGHCQKVVDMIKYIKEVMPLTKVIAGNVCTKEAAIDLKNCHADAIKVGLSCGAGCSTYNNTGVGSPMFSALLECSDANIPMIADGGIREIGDMCKALVAGASMVMVGSEFVKCLDSPAETIYDEKEFTTPRFKVYYGSASRKNKGEDKYVEGWEDVLLPVKNMNYLDYQRKIREGITSCMSYHNLRKVEEMKTVRWGILNS